MSIHFFCRLCPSSLSERFVIGIHGIYKKAWELCFCSLHTLRFSHCPEQMNEQRRSHAVYIHNINVRRKQ